MAFDLDTEVNKWAKKLAKYPSIEPGYVEEMTSHLLDKIDGLKDSGYSEEEAFHKASELLLDDIEEVAKEFRSPRSKRLRNKPDWNENSALLQLLPNYLKIALRNLRRNPAYSFINIFGLSIAIACCVLVLLFILQEFSYDKYHENTEDVYRVVKTRETSDGEYYSARSQVPLGPGIEEAFPEVEQSVRFWRSFQPVLGYENNFFNESKLYFTDPEVFDLFTFEFLRGNPASALALPGTIVVTESMADKYFGNANPIGETLKYSGYPEGELELTVTAVIEDLPVNTHLDFDFLVSMHDITTERENWGSHKPIWLYVNLTPNTLIAQLEDKLTEFDNQRSGNDPDSPFKNITHLEPISSVHLYSEFEGGFKPGGTISYVYIFSSLALFILLIGCVNFVNLATARGMTRTREVGVRKVIGAQQSQLVNQFLGESILLSTIAGIIGVFFAKVLLPFFNELGGLHINFGDLMRPTAILALIGLLATIGVAAGAYPSLFMARFKPVSVLKTKIQSGNKGAFLRKSLVVLQFSISVVLIISTLVMHKQLTFVQQKNLGFNKDHLFVVPYTPNEEEFITRMESRSDILGVTISKRVPVNDINYDSRGFRIPGQDVIKRFQNYPADEHFLPTYEMNLVAGRNFNPDIAQDSANFIINEQAAIELGWSTPSEAVGEILSWNESNPYGTIIGVVEDFHTTSLYEEVDPLVLSYPAGDFWKTFITLRISSADISTTLSEIEEVWKNTTPEGAFYNFFIDESLIQMHERDTKLQSLFSFLSLMAILISSLGLFGLTSFLIVKMQKAIGIHKILGASHLQVINLISKNFLALVGIGFAIAIPVAWIGATKWLEKFAYKINPGLTEIGLAALVILGSMVINIGIQTYKASVANPVKSLRSE
ncbi:MAG: ABC transporter permease [Balneolaceae bacterium]|nr:ABC transporter permease [Balneolaceae bacterium]MBO6546995.1 ABC transporter permease [Balneolaceae bacterium]MBO6649355.1 ABC transporter permease [Balneolaceae bacterium]